jgi:uncharacterized protein (TIGR02246 family)
MQRRMAVGVLAFILAFPCNALAQKSGDLHAQIEKLAQAWQKAYDAGDAAGVAALYSKDAVLMVPGSEPASGPGAIQGLIASDIKLGGKLTLTTQDVVGSGDYAVETGKWVANSPDGKHLDHGPYITVYRKAGDGWKIYRDTWNSSMPKK